MNNPFDLSQKTILITGASSGIGRACAITCANFGAKIILVGRNESSLEETKSNLVENNHKIILTDFNSSESINDLVKEIQNINGLIYSAGIVEPSPIKYLKEENLRNHLRINLEGAILLLSQLTKKKKLQNNSSVLFISSISSFYPYIGGAAYVASKAGLEGFMRTFAVENAHKKIRANCLAPAMVKSNMYQKTEERISKETLDKHAKNYPLGVGEPNDVANAALFLISDASKWITGITIPMDGGLKTGL